MRKNEATLKRSKNNFADISEAERIKQAAKGGEKSGETRRKKKKLKEVLDLMLSCKIKDVGKAEMKEYQAMGIDGDDITYMAKLGKQLYDDATDLGNETRDRIRAIEAIHKIVEGNKLDITSGGEKIKQDPITIEVIDSRDKVETPEEETDNETED
jgi:hypothetical protein